MKAKFFKSQTVKNLLENIEDNIDLYRSGNFDLISNDPANFFEHELEINTSLLDSISCTASDHNEIECCKKMYKAMNELTPYLARDERLWVYLSHTHLLNYARARWPLSVDDQKAITDIKTHFFCIGSRGLERNNVASRLWWMAYLCKRSIGLSFDDALLCFLFKTDVRANIIERPTTSQNVIVFSALLKKFYSSYKTDKALYERENYRQLMKNLNLIGGFKLLGSLPEDAIFEIIDDCIPVSS